MILHSSRLSKFSAVVRQGLYRRFSKVPVELTFLITLTSMLKAKFFTVKKKERKKKKKERGMPDLQDIAQGRGAG